jgi:hypothetical protein
MAAKIDERHEIVVRGEHTTFVFVADSREGRLVIRKEEEDGGGEVCSLSLSDPQELADFFEGLRRVLATPGLRAHLPDVKADALPAAAKPTAAAASSAATAPRQQQREEAIERARQRNPNAFAPWSREEEDALKQRHARGASFADMARAHNRSVHAIKMRLKRLGLIEDDE